MTASEPITNTASERLSWHPDYRGRMVAEVAAKLRADLEHDQRAYELALDSADEREGDTLAAVIDLEKRWGEFDMGWAECDAAELAGRIADFERERDRRQELFPYADYRETVAASAPDSVAERPWWAFWKR